MDILVTGGAGFIGSHIADAYIANGHRVTIIDDLSSGKKHQANPKAAFHELDILSPEVEDLFKENNFEIINHHAAQISVTESVTDPAFDAQVNILGSLNLLKLAKSYGTKKFIFASTGGALYGEQDYFPADETHPCRPIAPYGISKFCVENYLNFYKDTFNLNSTILRYSNVYGPRQDPHGEAGVVAIFCEKLVSGTPAIIFGDGEQTRDFTSVFDIVQANLTALSDSCSGTFNVGTAKETSVNQLHESLVKISGKNVSPKYDPPRDGEQKRSVIDFKKFHKEFGWEPKDSLESGLAKTYDFFLNK